MKSKRVAAGPLYRVAVSDVNAHLFQVTLTIAAPQAEQTVSMPVWIPGSYLVREFGRHLQRLSARQQGQCLAVQQISKAEWLIQAERGQALVLTYEVYAFDTSVRAAYLDRRRGFFNGSGLLLRVHGQEDMEHLLELAAPPRPWGWRAACGLGSVVLDDRGFGRYRASDYDELVDSPVEMGDFWSGEFRAAGVEHRFVVSGATPAFDGARLLADSQKICEAQIRFWHGRGKPPFRSYLFMLHAVDDGYGGLEHRNSTALIAGRKDLPRVGDARTGDGYTTLLGLISHEYFHTWNVKRLRPADFAQYDYSRENYTRLLWFFEGFTSYYDDLFLRRTGLIDDSAYLKLLTKTLNQVMQTPGRKVQSVAEASFDAWIKYYRQDENTPNATVSYYTKGALVALCLDLTLRSEKRGRLDDLMRALWKRCKGGPMSFEDLSQCLADSSGRPFAAELADWVDGVADLPLVDLLPQVGVSMQEEPGPLAQRLGIRVSESGGSVVLKAVLRGGAGESAGLAAGDEWLGVEVDGGSWRVTRLDDLQLYMGPKSECVALVSRDRRLLKIRLSVPVRAPVFRLVLRDSSRAQPWLTGLV